MRHSVMADHNGRKSYPWERMMVGDYFRVSGDCLRCLQQYISKCIQVYRKHHPETLFTTNRDDPYVIVRRTK